MAVGREEAADQAGDEEVPEPHPRRAEVDRLQARKVGGG